MLGKSIIKRWLFGLSLVAGALIFTAPQAPGQTVSKNELAPPTTDTRKTADQLTPVPVFKKYKGIEIGMTAEDVRGKLDHLKEKGKIQDFFVFSDTESAQVFYDNDGKVNAISIDYIGKNSNPPIPREVLGEDLPAKPDGSIYELRRYPSVGYWIAYNRTGGADPTVTITIQKD